MITKKIFYILLLFGIFGYSQQQRMWQTANNQKNILSNLKYRSSTPENYQIYQLDLNQLKTILKNAPKRETKQNSSIIVSFPMSNGKLERFKVYESSIMHPDLQAKHPNIRTYSAQGIDDPTATMRFSITQFGLHTMTLSGKHNAEYIDPYTTDNKFYIVYNRTSIEKYRNVVPFECSTEEGYHIPNNYTSNATNRNDTNDQVLRTYRLAQSCTAEYGNIFTTGNGTDAQNKADIQAQMTITINRVNEIYERDLAITLQFIPNNDVLIYYGNTNSDPWSNEWNNTTQTLIDNVIGDANYDIGHNFNTTGGGNAGCIACVCITGRKGSGYTGRADPTGDPFDIDYVAHEIGHQFGGYHTMNTCSRSGSGSTEVEPASGSSIMGYAGICTTNVQANSDAHFNYVNIRDISANIQTGNSTCGAQTVLNNNSPTANAGADYTIPANTAFVLEGTATDLDGTASLTYNWSQNDPEQAPTTGSPQSTWAQGPLYRAKLPITSLKRYLPQFTDVRSGNLTPTWEVTPSVSRNMEFSFIVRDNFVGGGQTASDLMNVTVDANAGPFTVTSQTAAQTWQVGSSQNITWNVANTNAVPINTANVDIYLTEDGETLVPVLLNTPNDGSETITVPSGLISTTARLLIKGHNTIFYAINSADITIEAGSFTMTFNATSSNVCAPNDATYTFTYNTYNGFNETTTFSATGNPSGSTVTFNPTQASADDTTITMTISGITNAMTGNYAIVATGTANSASLNSNLTLNIKSGTFNANLISPTNNAIDVSTGTVFNWNADTNADSYTIEIASDAAFTNIIDTNTQTGTSYTSNSLTQNTTYFWRVTYTNLCSTVTTTTSSFTTITACTICASAGNMDYLTSTTNVTFNTINNTTAKPTAYSDYTSISTDVFKDRTYDLSVKVNTDGNYAVVTKVWIDWNQDCDFDDLGEEYDLGSAVNTPSGLTSNSPLAVIIPNTALEGNTRMRVSSKYTSSNTYATSCQTGFDGEVEDYTITIKTFNDTCADAKSIQTGFVFDDYAITTTNVGATASGVTAPQNCNGFGNGEDVWYEITVPSSGNITIETQADPNSNLTDTVMSVFEGSCGTLTEITCNDDGGSGLFSLISLSNRTPGEILYVRVWEYNNNTFDTFLISAYDNVCANVTTIWDGTTWSNGTPTVDTPAIINGNYSNGSFTACELIVNKDFVLNLNNGEFIDIQNTIQNNGVINSVENSNIVQRSDTGKVLGTGLYNTEIKTTPLVDNDRFTYLSSPTVNESLTIFNSWAQMNRIWEFNDATQHWSLLNGNEIMESGKGYAVKPDSNLDYTNPVIGIVNFTNKYFNGIATRNLYFNVGQQEPDATDDDSNLIGNPYPSAIDAATLLTDNPNASAFYFWTHNTPITNNSYGDDYSIWNSSGGVASGSGYPAPNGIIARGQGFFVLATSAGNFTFQNSQRTTFNASFIRENDNQDKLWLNVTSQNNEFSQILLAFDTGKTDAYDNHFDAPRISLNAAPISLYSFGTSTDKYGIQTRNSIENETTIPLGIKILNNTAANYELAIDHFENLDNTSIYLKDNLLNILYDLKAENYLFNLNDIGEFNTRFEILFSKNALNVSENNLFENVLISNNSENINFVTRNNSIIKSIEIFDILGKRIFNKTAINTATYSVNTNTIRIGRTVLIIQTTLENGKIFNSKYILK